jgi:hypothetical protein
MGAAAGRGSVMTAEPTLHGAMDTLKRSNFNFFLATNRTGHCGFGTGTIDRIESASFERRASERGRSF